MGMPGSWWRTSETGGWRPGLIADSLGFALGVGALFLSPSLPAMWAVVPLAALAGAAGWRSATLRPLAFGAVGFLWAWIQACQVLCKPFPDNLGRRDIELTGRIASLPEGSRDAVRFLFEIERARTEGRDIDLRGLARLSWYQDTPGLSAGERWRLTTRLKPPHGFANPGGFDAEGWLFQQGIKATGYVRSSDENQRLDAGPGTHIVDRWRQRFGMHIGTILAGSTGEALVRALVLGDRSGLGQDLWEVLTRTGTNHLIAISGLHVGVVASFLYFLSRWTWSRSPRLTLMIAAPRAGAVAALAGAIIYSALAGFAVSTQRALVMLTVVLGAILSSRTLRPWSGISLALFGVLILDPRAVLSYGFWLSFGSVALLLHALGLQLAPGNFWNKWTRAQWAVALGLLPSLLFLFGRASLIAPLVNLIAVPLFSLLLPALLGACILSMVPGLEMALVLMSGVLERGLTLLEAASGWPLAAVAVSWRPGWVWVSAGVGALLLLAPRGLPGRWLGLVLLLALPLVRPPQLPHGEAKFTLLDVGQGLAAVVQTSHHTLIYDVGPQFPSGFDTGAAVVLPYLRHEGIGHIDVLVISHGDRDHSGGFAGLQGKISIGRILGGEPHEIPASNVGACLAGAGWTWDGVDFEFLYPDVSGREGNASSCVLRVSTGTGHAGAGSSLLLTGDIEAATEAVLAAEQGTHLASTLLVASHHGSGTSSSAAFLKAVAPRFVLYSAGFANRFGFPAASVRERVMAQGAAQIDTASAGAVIFRLGITDIEGPCMYRMAHRHLWSHRLLKEDATSGKTRCIGQLLEPMSLPIASSGEMESR